MISHLGQTSPYAVPDGLATWLACLLFLASLAVAIKKLREKPLKEPLRVRTEDDGVLRSDYDRDQKVVDERLTAATRSREKIHEQMSRQDSRITSLEKGEKHTDAALAQIDQKLTVVLQRLPKP
jgi:septal ring factor EnvC (AmiA/AmiB activator)